MSVNDSTCWSLYLLRRQDGGLYTGISTDVARRLSQHQAGKGSRSLRGKGLVGIDYSIELGSRSLASRVEYRVKQLAKKEKEALIKEGASKEGVSREALLARLGLQVD